MPKNTRFRAAFTAAVMAAATLGVVALASGSGVSPNTRWDYGLGVSAGPTR